MSERLQIRKYNKSIIDPLFSNQSKLLDKNRKPLLLQPPLVRTKLTVNQPGDEYEQEADRVAEQVMRMPINAAEAEQKVDTLQRKCGRATPTPGIVADPEGHLGSIQDDGKALPDSVRLFFEPRFGYDFSDVSVHADPQSSRFNRSLNARAFTVGHDIFFREGEFNGSLVGQRLLAHELTHVLQQQGNTDRGRSGQGSERKLSGQIMWKERDTTPDFQPLSAALPTVPVTQAKHNIGEPNDKFEQEADRVADMVMRMPEAMSSGAAGRTSASVYPSSAIQPHGIECGSSGVVPSSGARTPARVHQTIKISPFGQNDRELARKPLKEEDSKAELEFRSALHFNSTFSGFNPTGNPKEGDIFIIWWRVWNTGWKTAPEHTNRLTIYKADLCSGCRHEKDEIFRSEISAPSIVSITQQGKSDYENAVMIGMPFSPGHYDAYAELDVHNEVEEINKDNNTAFMVFDVRPRSESESAVGSEEEPI